MQKREELVEVISNPCLHFVQGLIPMSPDLETLFGARATTPPPKTVVNLDRARAHWKTAACVRKAAEASMNADLPDLAQPHMQEALQIALVSLQILHGVEFDDPANAGFDAESFGDNAALAMALYEQLLDEKNEAPLSTDGMQDLFNRIDRLICLH